VGKILHIEDVSWRRDGKPILSHINWHVEKGEHWALLGLNGAGKTTLLNLINGYIWPTKGTVRVLDQTFGKTDIREMRKAIGWVSSSLQERIKGTSIAEDIVVSGKFSSIGLYDSVTEKDMEKADHIMEQLSISYLKGRMYQTCSQGEQQRILIARGLMDEPELLILDEPTNGLDFIARERLLDSVHQLTRQENAPTIIFVTHHIEEILPDFTNTLLLRQGTVFGQGKREEVLTSERLSTFFDRNVQVDWKNNRPWMSLGMDQGDRHPGPELVQARPEVQRSKNKSSSTNLL